MANLQASFFCPQCKQSRLFVSTAGINHVFHLLITLFMCGLWLPVWILLSMTDKPKYHCSICGYSDSVKYLANPLQRMNEQIAAADRAKAKRKQLK